jgi:hypothetical protein
MTLRVVFRRAARAEFDNAALWYEERQIGLGASFTSEIERAVELASNHPERFPVKYGTIRCRANLFSLISLINQQRAVRLKHRKSKSYLENKFTLQFAAFRLAAFRTPCTFSRKRIGLSCWRFFTRGAILMFGKRAHNAAFPCWRNRSKPLVAHFETSWIEAAQEFVLRRGLG